MSARAQLKHVLLDVNLPHHNKVKLLHRSHKVAGKCSLYEIYAAMAKATDAIIDRELILMIAEENEVADPPAFFTYCLSLGLIQAEGAGFSNQPVIDDQESLYKTQERWRKSRGKSEHTASQPRSSSADAARKSEVLIIEELNTEGSKDLGSKKLPAIPFELPPKFDTPEIREYVGKVRVKFAKNRRHFDQTQFEALVMRRGCDPKLVLDSLVYTVGLTEAKNIIDPPEHYARGSPPPKKLSGHEKALELLKKIQTEDEDETRGTFEIDGGDSAGIPAAVRRIGRTP